MTGTMLLETQRSATCPASPPLSPHIINPRSSHSTLRTPLSQASPSLSFHCKPHPVQKPSVKALWASAHFCVSASSSESEQATGSGFLRKKLAVFVSGGGSNFQTLHEASLQNKVFGDFVVVVSDKPASKACDYARSNGIPILEYPHNESTNSGLSPSELVAALRQYEVDIALLAGYLKLVPTEVIQALPRAVLNIHPSLLPAFGGKGYYGRKVHEAVINSGARYTGPTVHFVDEIYDHGSIVAQRVVPVLPYDTVDDLSARVLEQEHILYPEVVAALCEGRIFWREDGVPMIRRSWDDAVYY
eukprot:c22209_g1_i1 orf=252-1160(-)